MTTNNSTASTGLVQALKDFENACYNLCNEVAGTEQDGKEELALSSYPLEIQGDLIEMLRCFADYSENVRKELAEHNNL